tara:strand:- start:45 stop:335 length:291 start_codon:yes stop_codon:yes gene_type:complete
MNIVKIKIISIIIMVNFNVLNKEDDKGCPTGISFSECRKYMKKQRKQKATHKKSRRKDTKKKKKKTVKRKHIPPKGVVIRKGNKLYRSNGKSLKPI